MDNITILENNLARNIDWIKAADSRVTLILPLATAMLGALAALTPEISKWTLPLILTFILTAGLLLCSLGFISLALFPRTDGPKNSLIYFGGIRNRNLEDYRNEMMELTESQYKDDLVNQCYINAKIAQIKFEAVKTSMSFLLMSGLPWLITIYMMLRIK